MKELLSTGILLFFCPFSTGADISMVRDFRDHIVDEFTVLWNVPTESCKTHGFQFKDEFPKYGITANADDKFRGENMAILYDPGDFPIMVKDNNNQLQKKNGGIPQKGNLDLHLKKLEEYVEKFLQKTFSGFAVIDFETWRPVFRQNWNDQVIYRNMSIELAEKNKTNQNKKPHEIRKIAEKEFEEAAVKFMLQTLQTAKKLRPNAKWGYYGFPYCYNYRNGKGPECPELALKENDRTTWLWEESTALYPSLYTSSEWGEKDQKMSVIGKLNEAWRISKMSGRQTPTPVFPYIWFKYYNDKKFMSKEDMESVLEITQSYKMGGTVIWGSSGDFKTKDGCQKLFDYLKDTLGPAILKAKNKKNTPVTSS